MIELAARAAVATVFGEYADPRQAQASSRPIDFTRQDPKFVYPGNEGEDFWFDFVADVGDGWNPTAAVASLIGSDQLDLGQDVPLKRGRLLVMGGDQVYPYPTRDAYRVRLKGPYNAVFPEGSVKPEPDLYAIPGNHDWYDGLNAFLGTFCARRPDSAPGGAEEGRLIGAWRTQQTRSYFALHLPQGWWLWGVDSQLSGYIDQPQVDYFIRVAKDYMPKGSPVILVLAEPSWLTQRTNSSAVRNFSFVYQNLIRRFDHKLSVVLSGNNHYFSCYEGDGVLYLTDGGGGAYTSGTQALEDDIVLEPPTDSDLPRLPLKRRGVLYPDKPTSDRKLWRSLLFPAFNIGFTISVAILAGIMMWGLSVSASRINLTLTGEGWEIMTAFATSELAWAIAALSIAGLAGLAGRRNVGSGLVHGVVQNLVLLLVLNFVASLLGDGFWRNLLAGALGGLGISAVFGVYLFASAKLKMNPDLAFSAIVLQDYKSFLRLRIRKDGNLDIYVVGLDRVPRKWNFEQATPSSPWRATPADAMEPRLIDHFEQRRSRSADAGRPSPP